MSKEISTILAKYENRSLSDLLMLNKYEMLVPFNLWFHDPDYSVYHESINGTYLRVRKLGDLTLSHVYRNNRDNLSYDVTQMSTVYQAFYPETFYQMWDLLSSEEISYTNILSFSKEINLGCVEAAVLYYEKLSYDDHVSDVIILDKDEYHNYLEPFGVSYNITQDVYDLIIIDTISKQRSLTKLDGNDVDKAKHLYHSNKHLLDINGTAIIRMNLLDNRWREFYQDVGGLIVRSKITNPLCGECFLITNRKGTDYDQALNDWLRLAKHAKRCDEQLPIEGLDMISSLPRTIEFTGASYEINSSEIDFSRDSCYDDDLLVRAKLDLNHVKRVMENKPAYITGKTNYFTWENVTRELSISSILKKSVEASHCTNAWLKCYEMLGKYKELSRKKKINAFHICEAPGAFILSCQNYYRKKNIAYEWHAQTLHTEVEGALEDHFNLIANNPDRWLFRPGSNGDITDVSTIEYYMKTLKGINFITADGGIGCARHELNDYDVLVAKLLLGQTVCILSCLARGGDAILKLFLPMSSKTCTSIIKVLSSVFKKVWFCKPLTSHSCNSEVYLIMTGYNKIDAKQLAYMTNILKNYSEDECFVNIDDEFLEQYTDIVDKLCKKQIGALSFHYAAYYDETIIPASKSMIKQLATKWLKDNGL